MLHAIRGVRWNRLGDLRPLEREPQRRRVADGIERPAGITGVVVATEATWFALVIAAGAGTLVVLGVIFAPGRARALEESDARRNESVA
jgi:hypothetical protein